MKYEDWNSSSVSPEQQKRRRVAACLFMGVIMFLISSYVLGSEIYFLHHATALDGVIVEVRHQYVPAGRGSELAYVPVVEVPPTHDRIGVDTSNEENIYSAGSKMELMCDLSSSPRCIQNTFFEKVGMGLVEFALALLLLVPSLMYLRRVKRQPEEPDALSISTQ